MKAILICLLMAVVVSPVVAQIRMPYPIEILEGTGYCTRVIDGDTIVVAGETVQLAGINAPDRGHRGFRRSRNFMRRRALNRAVHFVVDRQMPRDRFGRLRATVFVDGVNLNKEMVRRRLARRVGHIPS